MVRGIPSRARSAAARLSSPPHQRPMEISVYLQDQDHAVDLPAHRATRTVMRLVLAAELAKQIGQNAIRLTTGLDWREVKLLARSGDSLRRIELSPDLPIREYPINEICVDADFQRTMRYPLQIAKDQRSRYGDWRDMLQSAFETVTA